MTKAWAEARNGERGRGATGEEFQNYFRQMLLIRRFEEELIDLHANSAFPGHYHVYIGQEATGVGAIAALEPSDLVFTTHRSHGHLLTRGADPAAVLAEILGRVGGTSRGKGGTLHLIAPELGIATTSAMVGGSVPQATGAALAISKAKQDADERPVVMCFFGDGVFEEGGVFEALNAAALWNLPIIYVCENNSVPPGQWRLGDYPSSTFAGKDFVALVESLGIPGSKIDGRHVGLVAEHLADEVELVRGGSGPRFVETYTGRWPGGIAMFPSLAAGVTRIEQVVGAETNSSEHAVWVEDSDPLRLAYIDGEALGLISADDARLIDDEVRELISNVSAAALASPLPEGHEAFDHVRVDSTQRGTK